MVNVAYEIERLIKFAVRKKMITVWDIIPVRNSLMAVLNVEEPFQGEVKDDARETPVEILENILLNFLTCSFNRVSKSPEKR